MGVASGIGAVVHTDDSAATTVRQWKIQWRESSRPLYASDTQAGPMRIASVTDWKGYYTAYGAFPEVFPGETFQFEGWVEDPTANNGVNTGANGAMCSRSEVIWEQEKGLAIGYIVYFEANGTLNLNSSTGSADSGDPNPPTSVAMTLENDTVAITDVRYMKLTISADNRPYSSSATSGEMRRNAGNLDCQCVYQAYVDSASLAGGTQARPFGVESQRYGDNRMGADVHANHGHSRPGRQPRGCRKRLRAGHWRVYRFPRHQWY